MTREALEARRTQLTELQRMAIAERDAAADAVKRAETKIVALAGALTELDFWSAQVAAADPQPAAETAT